LRHCSLCFLALLCKSPTPSRPSPDLLFFFNTAFCVPVFLVPFLGGLLSFRPPHFFPRRLGLQIRSFSPLSSRISALLFFLEIRHFFIQLFLFSDEPFSFFIFFTELSAPPALQRTRPRPCFSFHLALRFFLSFCPYCTPFRRPLPLLDIESLSSSPFSQSLMAGDVYLHRFPPFLSRLFFPPLSRPVKNRLPLLAFPAELHFSLFFLFHHKRFFCIPPPPYYLLTPISVDRLFFWFDFFFPLVFFPSFV